MRFTNLHAKQSLSETVATFFEPDILDLIKSGFELLASNSDFVKSNETVTRPLLDLAGLGSIPFSLFDTRGLMHAWEGVMKSSTLSKKTDMIRTKRK